MSNQDITISINQIIQDCKITPRDAGNGKIAVVLEFPDYFNLLPLEKRTQLITLIQEAASSGALDQI